MKSKILLALIVIGILAISFYYWQKLTYYSRVMIYKLKLLPGMIWNGFKMAVDNYFHPKITPLRERFKIKKRKIPEKTPLKFKERKMPTRTERICKLMNLLNKTHIQYRDMSCHLSEGRCICIEPLE